MTFEERVVVHRVDTLNTRLGQHPSGPASFVLQADLNGNAHAAKRGSVTCLGWRCVGSEGRRGRWGTPTMASQILKQHREQTGNDMKLMETQSQVLLDIENEPAAGPHPTDTLHLAPCTLHPAPCTLHPAPCTLHPAPCTLHPAPYTLHPTPCTLTLHPTPCTLHPAPYTLHPTPCTLHPTPCTLHFSAPWP